jgi:hypothetical protein
MNGLGREGENGLLGDGIRMGGVVRISGFEEWLFVDYEVN